MGNPNHFVSPTKQFNGMTIKFTFHGNYFASNAKWFCSKNSFHRNGFHVNQNSFSNKMVSMSTFLLRIGNGFHVNGHTFKFLMVISIGSATWFPRQLFCFGWEMVSMASVFGVWVCLSD